MEKMRISDIDIGDDSGSGFIMTSRGRYPAICNISNIHFLDDEPVVQAKLDWIAKGKYTNGQRKKMVARTLSHILRTIVASERKQHTLTESKT